MAVWLDGVRSVQVSEGGGLWAGVQVLAGRTGLEVQTARCVFPGWAGVLACRVPSGSRPFSGELSGAASSSPIVIS